MVLKQVITECSRCGVRIYGRMNRNFTTRYVENQADSNAAERVHKHDEPWNAVQKVVETSD